MRRQRARELDAAEDRGLVAVERAHHPPQFRVGRAEAVDGVDDDREEADDGDHDELRLDPVAEQDREDRGEENRGHRL